MLFIVGLIVRGTRTILGMGYDSLAVLVFICQFTYRAVYAALGLVLAIIVGPAFVNVMWLLP